MASWSWKAGLASIAIVAAIAYAAAQMPDPAGMQDQMDPSNPNRPGMAPPSGGPAEMHRRMMRSGMHGGADQHNMMGMHGDLSGQPKLAGQDAFGAIREIVQILEADPTTDWSKVNIDALRMHLIDMSEVTLHATAAKRVLDNGVEINVTGDGPTLEAIKRMVPAHVAELVKLGWNAGTDDLPNGVKLTVITTDPKELTKLKALGFMGIMVQGGHHQPHHLMIAKGEMSVH